MLFFIVVVLLFTSDISICFQLPLRYPQAIIPQLPPPFPARFLPQFPPPLPPSPRCDCHHKEESDGSYIRADDAIEMNEIPSDLRTLRPVLVLIDQRNAYGPLINTLLIVLPIDVRAQYGVKNCCDCCHQQQNNLQGQYPVLSPLLAAPNKVPSTPSTPTNRPTTIPTITTTILPPTTTVTSTTTQPPTTTVSATTTTESPTIPPS